MIKVLVSFLLSLVVSAGLFIAMPLMQFLEQGPMKKSEKKRVEIDLSQTQMQQKKKPPPPKKKKLKPKPKKSSTNKKLSRSPLKMDLGLGGSGGAALGGSSLAGGSDVYEEGDIDDPATIQGPGPRVKYPEAAAKNDIHGVVMVLVTVGTEGQVTSIEVTDSPGPYGFEAAIRDAYKKVKFQPAMKDGIPVQYRFKQPFKF